MFFSSFWSDGLTISHYSCFLNPHYLKIALNSLIIAFGTTFFSLLIGTPQAFLLQRTKVSWRNFFKVAYLIPLLIPPYIHAIVWTYLLSKKGIINQYLIKFFHLKQPLFSIYGIPGVIFVLTLAYSPLATALVISGLKSIDYSLEEVALLYHTPFQIFKKITLPLLTPHIFSGAIFVFVFSIINFGVPDFLRVSVYPTEIFVQFSAYYNEKTATALSVPLVIFTIFLIILIKRFMQNRPYITITSDFKYALCYKLDRKLNTLAFLFLFLLFFLSTIIPIAVLIKKSGSWSNYCRVLLNSSYQISYSLILSFLGTIIMVILSFFISCFIERIKSLSNVLEYASLIPFAIPATVLGIGLIKVWNHSITQFVYNSSIIILIAYIAHFIPFTTRIIISELKRISLEMEEAAFLISSNWFYVIRKIIVPLSYPGLLISFFIGFILCFGDLVTSLLIIPPGRETVPIKAYNLMHYGAEHLVSALCLILILIILIIGSFFYICYQKIVKYD